MKTNRPNAYDPVDGKSPTFTIPDWAQSDNDG